MIKQMFSGRIGIKQYWLSAILLILLAIGIMFLLGVLIALGIAGAMSQLAMGVGAAIIGIVAMGVIGFLISMLLVIPAWGLAIRRYHDVGLSGWVFLGVMVVGWIISAFFPILTVEGEVSSFSVVNFLISLPISIVSIGILLWPGAKGDNKFGPETKYESLWKAIKGKKPEALPAAAESAPLTTPVA